MRDSSAGSVGHLYARTAGYWNVGKGSTWRADPRAGVRRGDGQIAPATSTHAAISATDILPTLSAPHRRAAADDACATATTPENATTTASTRAPRSSATPRSRRATRARRASSSSAARTARTSRRPRAAARTSSTGRRARAWAAATTARTSARRSLAARRASAMPRDVPENARCTSPRPSPSSDTTTRRSPSTSRSTRPSSRSRTTARSRPTRRSSPCSPRPTRRSRATWRPTRPARSPPRTAGLAPDLDAETVNGTALYGVCCDRQATTPATATVIPTRTRPERRRDAPPAARAPRRAALEDAARAHAIRTRARPVDRYELLRARRILGVTRAATALDEFCRRDVFVHCARTRPRTVGDVYRVSHRGALTVARRGAPRPSCSRRPCR